VVSGQDERSTGSPVDHFSDRIFAFKLVP